MKVVINTNHENKDHYTELYNIIKRSEEDLLNHIPNLQEISVDVARITSSIASNLYGVITKHTLVDDESQLHISVKYRTDPTPEQIAKGVTQELKHIKEKYY
ncbi:hypothetical protein [Flavobacterium caeni]|uniref:Sigma 54 modulation protein / S30EA ribosomal protein n=1 Tax=Flavobacterium caeni TaxID=490189 RepID=A0A1G5JK06_9FLAO|nr:hypothetical protein [Flavobacterium caeni]SCY88099.1 hypothetical protein SAMN02927903_02730 [Flavobacterium caeni]